MPPTVKRIDSAGLIEETASNINRLKKGIKKLNLTKNYLTHDLKEVNEKIFSLTSKKNKHEDKLFKLRNKIDNSKNVGISHASPYVCGCGGDLELRRSQPKSFFYFYCIPCKRRSISDFTAMSLTDPSVSNVFKNQIRQILKQQRKED